MFDESIRNAIIEAASEARDVQFGVGHVPTCPPPERCRRLAELLRPCADPTRIAVVLLLAERERNTAELSDAIGASQPSTSHHLGMLRMARVVQRRRAGKGVIYSLTPDGRRVIAAIRAIEA